MRTPTGITLSPRYNRWFSIQLTTWHIFVRLLWFGVDVFWLKGDDARALDDDCRAFSVHFLVFPAAITARR